jgi:hypothetical protein
MIDKLGSQGLHMPNESLALVRQRPDAPGEDAYQAFCATLSESARGRAFLAEYARRNRNADTELLLAALERLEALVRAHMTPAAGIRAELRALLETIRSARPQIDARALPARAAKLAALLDLLERRIDEIAKANDAEPATPADATLGVHAMPDKPADEAARSHLAVVEPPDEPELPIPSPSAQPPAIALVHHPEKAGPGLDPGWEPVFGQDDAQIKTLRSTAIMPEVNVFDQAPPEKAAVEITIAPLPVMAIIEEIIVVPVVAANTVDTPAAQTMAPAERAAVSPIDLLAPLMALSEEERIALFT